MKEEETKGNSAIQFRLVISKGIIALVCEIICIKRFSAVSASTGSQETPKKVCTLEVEGKSVQGLSKLANWNRDRRKLNKYCAGGFWSMPTLDFPSMPFNFVV